MLAFEDFFGSGTSTEPELKELQESGWRPGSNYSHVPLRAPMNWTLQHRQHTFHLNSWGPFSRLLLGYHRFHRQSYFETAYAGIMDWLLRFQAPALSMTTLDKLDR